MYTWQARQADRTNTLFRSPVNIINGTAMPPLAPEDRDSDDGCDQPGAVSQDLDDDVAEGAGEEGPASDRSDSPSGCEQQACPSSLLG